MVKIISFKTAFNSEGKEFVTLKVQGGVEPVQSKQTGKLYLTTKSAYVPCTFDEATAESLIGSELPGKVVKVPSDEYEYTIKESGEVVTLFHRYEYQLEDVPTPASSPVPQEAVLDLMEA